MKFRRVIFLLPLFSFCSKIFAQSFNKNSIIGFWEFGSDMSYTSRNFVNDSILVVSSYFGKTSSYNYELDTSNPNNIILIEKYKDPDSITTVQSHLQIIKDDELILQILKIKHYNTYTKAWGEFSLPADAIITFKRRKK